MSTYGLPQSALTYNGNNTMQHQEYLRRRGEDRRSLLPNGSEGAYSNNNKRHHRSENVYNTTDRRPLGYINNNADRKAYCDLLKQEEDKKLDNFWREQAHRDYENMTNHPELYYVNPNRIVNIKTKWEKFIDFLKILRNNFCCCSSHYRY